MITAQVLAEMAAFSASRSLNGMWVMPSTFGPKPSEYLAWPPTLTVNRVRPWKLLTIEMISYFSGP
ncbi:hypothetical protein D3C81_1810430 [compost metagenome]